MFYGLGGSCFPLTEGGVTRQRISSFLTRQNEAHTLSASRFSEEMILSGETSTHVLGPLCGGFSTAKELDVIEQSTAKAF